MIPEEHAIIDDLEHATRQEVRRLVAWAEPILEGTGYRLSIESFTKPWIGGRRTVEQQAALYAIGRKPGDKRRPVTMCDGVKRKSKHQSGRATHLGLRKVAASRPGYGAWVRYQPRGGDPTERQLFLIVVREAKRRGFIWGGDWPSLRDYHHIERP